MLCNQMNNTVLSYFYGWRAGEVLWMHTMRFMDLFWISWMHIYVFMDARMFVKVCVKGAMDGVLDGVRPV